MTDTRTTGPSPVRFLLVVGVILLLLVGGYLVWKWGFPPGGSIPFLATPTPLPIEGGEPQPTTEPGEPYGIDVELSEGSSAPQVVEPLPVAAGDPLGPEEIEAILARLPALAYDPDEQVSFNLPPETLPPPRPGQTIAEPFPPLESEVAPGAVASGPLQVLRYAPEGEIPIAPFVSVTFNQPMVALGTLEDLSREDVPVQIEPSLPGKWRWLGTKTLTFEYDSELIDRLPKATEYRVTVPAGTQSATGGILAEPVTWAFSTPAPKLVTSYPGSNPQPLDPILFAAFDQRIDPQAVLRSIEAFAGNQSVNLLLATEEEIEKDVRVAELAENAVEGRWLAFRATKPFPPETTVNVTIEPGTPSAEGPLVTTEAQAFSFSTYAPLRVDEYDCSWYDDRCPPLTPFFIRFNNPLELSNFSETMVRVTPEIPGLTVNAYGSVIEISGETRGQTTYTVTVSGLVQDIFGQRLGRDTR
ncbi:MAG: hypothetical protein FJZ87_10420 [Chloroflexi bacterium]|nr:hypothetical protein [Chloroflexota bacterium]